MTLLLRLFYFFKKVWRPLVMFCQQHMPRPESRPPHLHEHCSRLRTPLSMLNPELSEKDARSPPARGEEMLTAPSACCRQKKLCNLHGAFPKVSPKSLGNDRTGFFTSISTGEAGGRDVGVTDPALDHMTGKSETHPWIWSEAS